MSQCSNNINAYCKDAFHQYCQLSSGNVVLIYTRTGITDLGSEGGKEIGKMPRNGEKRILYKKQEGSELRLYL